MSKCIACGACVRECPRELIRIHECANPIVVKCSNKDLGKNARKYCEVSCIGCGICEKVCPAGAIARSVTIFRTSTKPTACPAGSARSSAREARLRICAAF